MPRHLKEEFERTKTRSDRLADAIARFVGNMKFVYFHAAFFLFWVGLNTIAWIEHWDPYPFNFLTLIVSLEAIFLATFVLISQNRQERRADLRAQLDYEVNVKAEREVETILKELREIRQSLEADRKKWSPPSGVRRTESRTVPPPAGLVRGKE